MYPKIGGCSTWKTKVAADKNNGPMNAYLLVK